MVRAGRDLDDHLVPTTCNLQVFFLEAGVLRDRRVKKAAPVELCTRWNMLGHQSGLEPGKVPEFNPGRHHPLGRFNG